MEVDTNLIMLGTGTPVADANRSGPALAMVVGERPYLVDCGPGVVRQTAAAWQKGVAALDVKNLSTVFITHLHSDHTLGFPDLIYSPWVLGRRRPLEAYGPAGLKHMAAHIVEAWADDRQVRSSGLEYLPPDGGMVRSHEIMPGKIYEDTYIQVEAIAVSHGSWRHALAYKFTTADQVVLVSGDTSPNKNLEAAAMGCDILVHEVYLERPFRQRPGPWPEYHRQFHTSTTELAEMAGRIQPKLLVLYHLLTWGFPETLLIEEIRAAGYDGEVVVAEDLDIY
jgi:ribonuclease BN (tRNA processing enzyme)